MDKDILKGLLFIFGFIAIVLTLFLTVSDEGSGKAECIADALKNRVPVATIDQRCRLTETRPKK
jgi:hypothetical protein